MKQAGILRSTTASGLFALLVLGTVPLDGLRAQAQNTPRDPQQKSPITVPSGPSGDTKSPDHTR